MKYSLACLMLWRHARQKGGGPIGRVCTICSHPERESIDRAIVNGRSNRLIAEAFNLGDSAIRRHKVNHLPQKLVRAHQLVEASSAADLLPQLESLQVRTLAIFEAAESSGQLRTALAAAREVRANLEFFTRVLVAAMFLRPEREPEVDEEELNAEVMQLMEEVIEQRVQERLAEVKPSHDSEVQVDTKAEYLAAIARASAGGGLDDGQT